MESTWTSGELPGSSAERLREIANELQLEVSVAAEIEREVMGDTKETIIERQEAAREKDRKERLNELYAQARRSHQNQEWQAVIGLFEQIRAEESDYPDPEGLLASTRDTLEAQERRQRVALPIRRRAAAHRCPRVAAGA